MSMPFEVIQCSRCDFSASSSQAWGRFYYVLDDQRLVPLCRTLSWCHDCKSIRAIEDLSIDLLNEKIRDRRKKVRTQHALVSRRKSMIWPFNLLLSEQQTARKIRTLDHCEQALQDELDLLSIVEARQSEEKCLVCSSPHVTKVDVPSVYSPETSAPIDFRHPDCGGALTATGSTFWINVILKSKHYDTEGVFLYEE